MGDKDLAVGDRAPDFVLLDEQGRDVKLSDFRGKQPVVLVFYPGDLTPGCVIQLCAIRDDWSKFAGQNIALFGVNHAGAESHGEFIEKMSLPFPLLIDEGKKVSKKYGALKTMFKAQVIKRSVVGIDKDGVIRYLKRGMPKDSEILKAMQPYR